MPKIIRNSKVQFRQYALKPVEATQVSSELCMFWAWHAFVAGSFFFFWGGGLPSTLRCPSPPDFKCKHADIMVNAGVLIMSRGTECAAREIYFVMVQLLEHNVAACSGVCLLLGCGGWQVTWARLLHMIKRGKKQKGATKRHADSPGSSWIQRNQDEVTLGSRAHAEVPCVKRTQSFWASTCSFLVIQIILGGAALRVKRAPRQFGHANAAGCKVFPRAQTYLGQ